MSENKIQNEDELWDLLSSEPETGKSEPSPAKPQPKAEPAVKSARKVDGFFIACMAGVAAVSVAATLLIGDMVGGGSPAPSGGNNSIVETNSDRLAELEKENAELRAQLELQKEQVKDLQNDLMTLMGSEEYLSSAATDPDGGNETMNEQIKAYEILAQIQEAYADFDRERLEELIPQMDEMIGYLSPDALNNYYLILEYAEQPSNG